MNDISKMYIHPETSISFRGIVESLYILGLTPKSSGFIYLVQFLMLNSVDSMTKTTYDETIRIIADANNISTRKVIDNMTLTLNNAWNRFDVRELLLELFKKHNGTMPKKRPRIRKMLIMFMLFCEVMNSSRDNIYTDYFGFCFKKGITLNL